MSSLIVDVVAEALEANGQGTIGVNIFKGSEKPSTKNGDIPADAIFVFVSDGFVPSHYMGCADSYRQSFVECFIRSDSDKEIEGQDRAQNVLDFLDRALFPSFAGFVRCDALRSAPALYGRNKDQQYIYHIRFKFGYDHTKV